MRTIVRATVVATVLILGAAGLAAPAQASPPPELQRLLDLAGRYVPRATLGADGMLDGLLRATRPVDPGSFDSEAEDTTFVKPAGLGTGGKTFDMAWFERNLRAALDGKAVGYAYSIGKSGKLDRQAGVGFARVAADSPITAQSASKVMTVASISKPVTAAATLRLLEQKGISVDSPIGPWLPEAWKRGTGVDAITFRDLMTHRSGLLQNYQTATGTTAGKSTGSWDNIRIAVGQNLGSKSYKYANMNFSIFRIIVPKIAYGLDLSKLYDAPPANVTPAQIDYLTGMVFVGWLKPVLAPAGAPVSCSNADPNPTKLYATLPAGQPGWGPADYVSGCGGYGYNMSANGIASFISHVRYSTKLVSASARSLMVDGQLGLKAYSGKFGTYHGHGAVWAQSGGRGMRGCVMSFNIEVDVALLINSRGDFPQGCTIAVEAFDNAWH
jgi:CubicO group peptidase (beta-lactamase class C family)